MKLGLIKLCITKNFPLILKKKWQALNEQEIAYKAKLLRPDRICLQNKEAVILDYKTGLPNVHHQHQINDYKNAVEALGYNVKKCYLIYLNEEINVIEI